MSCIIHENQKMQWRRFVVAAIRGGGGGGNGGRICVLGFDFGEGKAEF